MSDRLASRPGLSRRNFLVLCGSLLASPPALFAGDPPVHVRGTLIDGPASPSQFPSWIAGMKRWRAEQWERVAYDGSNYDRPQLQWTQQSFVQTQLMVGDRYFYDPVAGKYTVDRYLDDLEKRYGGIDSIVLWPTYPNLGIDNRNQFDMFGDLPGGISGVRQVVADFHRRGVRVLFPLMPWDRGTRREGGSQGDATRGNESMMDAIVAELVKVNADGINGDTMDAMPREFLLASEKLGHPLTLEPEHLKSALTLAYDSLSWGHAFSSSGVPGSRKAMLGLSFEPEHVDLFKWLEPRHLDIVSDRWQRDKTADIQYAYFNGCGIKSWENIWGIWNGLTQRDAETLRRVAKIDRMFASLLVSPDWEPHTPMLQFGVYASKWPAKDRILWTVINKNDTDLHGEQIRLKHNPGWKYFDLWHGVPLHPRIHGGSAILSFRIEGSGFGALLATGPTASDDELNDFLDEMRRLNRNRLDSLSKAWSPLPQTIVAIPATKPASAAPQGMIRIPAAQFEFQVHGIEIEGGDRAGVDVQYPWEDAPRRHHFHFLDVRAFYIDRYPVTNEQFQKFIAGSGYHPKDGHNFLKDWKHGSFPEGWEAKPVTWVSIEDARAYAAWAGKRLPHEWEWQYAAQSSDGRRYPWGDRWRPEDVPAPDRGRTLRGPDGVSAHPGGASPFGVEDLVGNVWQWTDEFEDEHTRAAILRGGSYYQPQGSRWYFPEAYELGQHGKLLLMSPGRDRSGTIGFRCVVDVESI